MYHMNMNGFMLIRIEIKDKSKVFKYLRHIVFVFCLQKYYFFSESQNNL